MALNVKIQHRGRYVYAVWSDYLTNDPIRRDLWWLLDIPQGVIDEGQEASFGEGTVRVKTSIGYREIHVLDPMTRQRRGGSAQAEFVEETPVPLPKVRSGIETRWYQSRWQKYTKAKGWIDV